ncbi:MAG: phosphomannomutase/phosphoglucomutase, partial [Candidatus Paceibacterota bacterium]
MHFHDIVKSYDVRAIHPDQITDAHVEVLGRAFAHYLNARTIAVGRDCRTSSPAFHRAVVNGITAHGVNVVDLGEVSTPMVYHAAGTLDVDGAVMITASHNPPKYNGMKFVRPGAVLIGRDSGLADIQRIAEEFVVKAPAPAAQPG